MTHTPRALTVKQPWAWAIIEGNKDVENRSRPINYRGTIYIHAGKGYDLTAPRFPKVRNLDFRGVVIGAVDIIGCHHWSECRGRVRAGHLCSEWAMEGHYHWELANPQPVDPFPAQGKLGLWKLATL